MFQPLEARRLFASPAIDLAFGQGGLSFTPAVSGDVYAVRQLPDGKIIMVAGGRGTLPGDQNVSDDPFVARFDADGSLDSSFDGDGMLGLPQDDSVVGVDAATIGPDGKIYFFHSAFDTGNSANDIETRIFRFNADGTIDDTFGIGGKVTFPSSGVRGRAITVQADGKILLTYSDEFSAVPPSTPGLFLARLNADGSPDAGFRAPFPTLSQPLPITNIDEAVIGPDGKFYLAGQMPDDANFKSVLLRLNASGTTDSTFGGGDGIAETGAATDAATTSQHVAFDSAGRIVVAGQVTFNNVVLARLTTAGARDVTFGGGDGEFVFDADDMTSGSLPWDVVVDSADRPLLAYRGNSDTELLLARFTTAGALDTTFDAGGVFDAGRLFPRRVAMAFDNTGNVLLAGEGDDNFGYDLALTRVVPTQSDVFVQNGKLYVAGTNGDDTISVARSGANIVVTRNGATTSHTGVTGVAVFGQAGNDVINISVAIPSTVNGGHGNDVFTAGDGNLTFQGENGDDRITAGAGNHAIYTLGGNDTVTTGAGNDHIESGSGSDLIVTGDGNDYIEADSASGGQGNDTITAGNGDDTIYVGGGFDSVRAGAGNDLIAGNAFDVDQARTTGKKALWGEDGNDTIVGGQAIDYVDGANGNDSILGGDAADEINAGAGDDVVWGDESGYHGHFVAGNDYILAGDGNDWVDAEKGKDTVFGGAGDDKLFGSEDADSLWGEDGLNKIYGGDGHDSLYGNGGGDTVYGNAQNDWIRGTGGRDKIYGNGGNDRLFGGASGDWIYGQAGEDQIHGEGGNDRLYGDDGYADTLRGGAGDDVFITLDDVRDELFGDGGDDSANADGVDILTSIGVSA